MAKQKKFYVIWLGHVPGVYADWATAKQQVDGYKGAKYKSFPERKQAEAAYAKGFQHYLDQAVVANAGSATKPRSSSGSPRRSNAPSTPTILSRSISVDAACSGNPGAMEYQGVTTAGQKQLFHRAFKLGTNNIGEFLALVHAFAFLKSQGMEDLPIYSDSQIAIGWVKKGKCKTTLARSPKTEELYTYIDRAEEWLKNNRITNPVYKWNTEAWGEIPADFGRK
ncbi:ribonuclease H family protein [Neolewinella lacunae]|uniref:Ribonuclease H n=1 Tax=Neolewinella lacunae TaxID=1517758 RepID=A0A923PHK7_9BACT|nr:ribonuclease H family protein [Neolewinella lacunae]MBC6992750.1 ribonuclease H family protein [Neolewinella lacunae]MDN3635994.1 ribonuclease H family protein [Neolewinella lacunae]